ncbi:class I SAM-dependent methyltransferase [Nocardioides sp. HB32]
MPFFDFLRDAERYASTPGSVKRLNTRHRYLVKPYAAELEGSSVLDLASHDGRWSYALSAAGAREVVGIEARAESIAGFAAYPDGPVKDRIGFIQGDVYEELPRLVAEGRRFDVVALLGLFYHVMDHYGLLKLIARLEPRLVIVDSEFALSPDPIVRLIREKTDNRLNSIAHVPDQVRAPAGIPSRSAMELMAETLGYAVEWADWETLPEGRRAGLRSYFREPPEIKRRHTCALRPL